MSEKIYFQWQNDYLLRTIYPLRELKLRDFLVAYFEIDIWQHYKDKTPQDIPDQVQSYCDSQRDKLQAALAAYQQLETYFYDPDVSDEYQAIFLTLDPLIQVKINDLHVVIKRYFPNYHNPVKEKYFLSERVRQFEALRKNVLFQISEKYRIMRNMGPAWPKKAAYASEAERLASQALPMVERELGKLQQFQAAYERLDRYRQELTRRKIQGQKEREVSRVRLQTLRSEMDGLQSRLFLAQQAIQRMANPPDYDTIRDYFLDDNVTDLYEQRFPLTDTATMLKINQLHQVFQQYFPHYRNVVQEKYFLGQRLLEFKEYHRRRHQDLSDRERALQWRGISDAARAGYHKEITALRSSILPMVDEELARLEDFQWAFDLRSKPASNLSALIEQKEKERDELQGRLHAAQVETRAQEEIAARLESAASATESDQLLGLIDPSLVTVKDVVREHVEDFRAAWSQKSHKELLEAVVKTFIDNPQRYPLWLQYMVIHFSGMRYQSAHGSWADPKGLLLSLRMRFIDQELRRLSSDSLLAQAQQRLLCYQSARGRSSILDGAGDEEYNMPALSLTDDKAWLTKIDYHLKVLDPAHYYHKFKALLDLRIDEEEYEIEQMSDQQVLEELRELKDVLPKWMWDEIVRVTELRLTEVVDANWEQLTAEDIEARNQRQMGAYRAILYKWKAENLTGWREEHDTTNRLIVSRAVCNEVAEHIQHTRGLTPPGGLTAKPEWYRRKEKDVIKTATGQARPLPAERPFLVKPRSAADFKVGASILWIQWVHKMPNPWQIARPMALNNGELLLAEQRDALNQIRNAGSHYERHVTIREKDAHGNPIERSSVQFLRWLHEATVVEVAETADGPTVLTFETALPTDDKRQATIGVFKRLAIDLRHQAAPSWLVGTFVGYMPAGDPPYQALEDMLNWNRILLRDAYTQKQMDNFWQKVGRPVTQARTAETAATHRNQTMVEIAPQLSHNHAPQAAGCYEISPTSGDANCYLPEVNISRGVRLAVCKEETVQVGGALYYPVTQCTAEPRAEGLYLRAADLLETGENGALPRTTRKDIVLYQLEGCDHILRATFAPGETSLVKGTALHVSSVHCIGPKDPGGGVVRAKNGQHFYLIIECSHKPSAEGWFVRKKDLK